MTTKAQQLIGLLGKEHVDADVRQALAALGVDEKKVRLKRGHVDMNVVAEAHGVEIEFADQTKYKFDGNLPDGALVLGAVFFSPVSQASVGALPHGVRFDMTREQAATELGRPVWSSPWRPSIVGTWIRAT